MGDDLVTIDELNEWEHDANNNRDPDPHILVTRLLRLMLSYRVALATPERFAAALRASRRDRTP
jgi:hypothetical protein